MPDSHPRRGRVSSTAGALAGVRTARRRFRCDGHLTDPDDRHWIEPGARYVATALPPHSELGNTGWWHARFCRDCCPEQHAAEVRDA